ncbi:hypothetical protein H311_05117 [Anncaliia algerae PRA109]|nr:hypothetical protein H311_05198 [Anncaliia algerae PRA109]KCZ73922.1 hypothetical protein H311_05117 [Anncaliia algerae PRA109]
MLLKHILLSLNEPIRIIAPFTFDLSLHSIIKLLFSTLKSLISFIISLPPITLILFLRENSSSSLLKFESLILIKILLTFETYIS